ncbi:MAG: tRNA (guanosine(37)-N1)-methyltransferase TrmD [Proteobacteria bacterium]|nr:tRNA (guanosine(37)-N1)-methyltransferase TrmD [Pseudomonadota bacterium]
MSWHASVLTLFPEMFPGPLGISLLGKALEKNLWSLDVRDIREHGLGKHRSVDDTPAGGGPGMVMRADVACAAIDAARATHPGFPSLYLSPRGRPLTQSRVRELSAGPGVLLLCGRFEGLDQRAVEARSLEEVSLGDFVLAGGEIAAMALIEACVRLIPGVLGAEASPTEESFENGLLEYPQFTRPQSFEGRDVPDVLTQGNHKEIAKWRRSEAEALTRKVRPDLWALYEKKKP